MYNVVIKLFCKKGDVEMAEKKEMSLNGLCPDLITYMTMIEVLCNVGRLEDAYSMLRL
jgi:pentatricopeptide repeat protein